jgi:hypothetical protein
MKDKSLGILLIVLFGIPGMAVLLMGWLWPIFETERITATFAGSAGLFVASIQALLLKRSLATDAKKVPTRVRIKDRV